MINQITITKDNINLNVITYDLNNPSAILIHLHGLGNHFQPISEFDTEESFISFETRTKYLLPLNIKSYGLELRGHGLSSGTRFMVNSIDEYISDINCLVEYIVIYHPKIPIYIIGESLGGALSIKYCITYKDIISGIILMGPMCGISMQTYTKQFSLYFLLALSYIYPSYEISLRGDKSSYLSSSNEKYYKAKINCKYTNHNKIRANTARECYYITLWIDKNINLLTTPIIAFHSKNDMITNPDITKDIINRCSSVDKECIITDIGDHLLLIHMNDDDTQPCEIMTMIYNWLNKMLNNK